MCIYFNTIYIVSDLIEWNMLTASSGSLYTVLRQHLPVLLECHEQHKYEYDLSEAPY